MIIRQVVRGIKYLHQQDPPVAHRDIKVENILWTKTKVSIPLD